MPRPLGRTPRSLTPPPPNYAFLGFLLACFCVESSIYLRQKSTPNPAPVHPFLPYGPPSPRLAIHQSASFFASPAGDEAETLAAGLLPTSPNTTDPFTPVSSLANQTVPLASLCGYRTANNSLQPLTALNQSYSTVTAQALKARNSSAGAYASFSPANATEPQSQVGEGPRVAARGRRMEGGSAVNRHRSTRRARNAYQTAHLSGVRYIHVRGGWLARPVRHRQCKWQTRTRTRTRFRLTAERTPKPDLEAMASGRSGARGGVLKGDASMHADMRYGTVRPKGSSMRRMA